MDNKSSNKIIQGKMKNMEVIKVKRKKTSYSAGNADSKSSIQQSPSLAELQKKYMNPDAGYQPDSFVSDSSPVAAGEQLAEIDGLVSEDL